MFWDTFEQDLLSHPQLENRAAVFEQLEAFGNLSARANSTGYAVREMTYLLSFASILLPMVNKYDFVPTPSPATAELWMTEQKI